MTRHNCNCNKSKSRAKKECDYVISKRDFRYNHECSLSKSFIIDKPGKYCLQSDIKFDPKHNKSTAIVINSDDVVLDLCGKTLEHVNKLSQVTGVFIKAKKNRITVKNGWIKNFTKLGLVVDRENQYVTIDTVTINGCGNGTPTALIDGDEPIFQGGARLGSSVFYKNGGYPGDNTSLKHIVLNKFNCEYNYTFGVVCGNIDELRVYESSFSYNFDDRVVGGPLIGNFFPAPEIGIVVSGFFMFCDNRFDPPSVDWIMEDTKINGNNIVKKRDPDATVLLAFVLSMEQSVTMEGHVFRNCQFNFNKISNTLSDQLLLGYCHGYDSGGGKCMTFDNCQFCGNEGVGDGQGCHFSGTVPGFPAAGFPGPTISGTYIPPYDWKMINCQASGNRNFPTSATTRGRCFGFDSAAGERILYENCKASDNVTVIDPEDKYEGTPGNLPQGAGFNIFGVNYTSPSGEVNVIAPCKNFYFRNCESTGNGTNSLDEGSSCSGFAIPGRTEENLPPSKNIVIENCIATENTNPSELGSRKEAGITSSVDLKPPNQAKNVTIKNCVISDHTTAGILGLGWDKAVISGNEINDSGVGILLEKTTCSTIVNNLITSTGTGVKDLSNPSDNFVGDNKSYNNTVAYDVNYTFGPVPVVSGDISVGYPALPSVSFENVNMSK